MLEDIPDEYEIDPGTDIDRLAEIFVEQYPDAVRHTVDEAIFADDGPVDYLTWVALDGYSRHEFFYYDSDPDSDVLRTLLSLSPNSDDMPTLQAYLNSGFDIVEPVEHAAVLAVPDPYLPGSKPQANVAFYQNPTGEEINIGLNATPLQKEEEILEHVDRLVPAKNLETFTRNVVYSFYDELEETAQNHLIEGDVLTFLKDDPDFRYQTTKLLPDGVYPTYTGEAAQMWQKPVSKEPDIEGSQGFIRIWVPENETSVGFVDVTAGQYEIEQALNQIRDRVESALD